ncbi:MAG: hypothetical protein JWO93_709 [Micrococcaceae bacterium]|jgi:hypothetical protein|nr:hypothetical protein [Micrococcaceae bacterium]
MKPFYGFETPKTICGSERDGRASSAMILPAAAAHAPGVWGGRP